MVVFWEIVRRIILDAIRLLAVVFAMFFVGTVLADGRSLTLAELEEKFAGEMMGYVGEGDKAIFSDDGKVKLVLYGGYQQTGTYSLEEGKICFELPNLSYCELVFEENGEYYVLDRNSKRKAVMILN